MDRTFPPKRSAVVMVDTIDNPGGGERLAVENAIRLDPERWRRTLCITRWEDSLEHGDVTGPMLARLRAAEVEVVGLDRDSRLALWQWRPLVAMLRARGVEVVHGHMFGSNLWAALLGRLAGVPAIVAHEHMWSYGAGGGERLRPFLDREVVARGADAFIAVSEEGRRRMIETERIPPEETVLIENGIEGFALGDGARVRGELGIAATAPVVGTVGHLRPEKAHAVLVEAAALIRAEHPDLVVLVAGEGIERPALEELIGRLALGDSVRLLGAREDIPDFLAALDVAVCCSDFEGGPLSVMEYMEAELPVVATDVGGLPELVAEGETGFLVPPRDPAGLAAATSRLLADPDLRARFGALARKRRRERWDLDGWARRLEALYDEILSRPGH
jgi:glycosyltransferase involved in cell wall biosynthesis